MWHTRTTCHNRNAHVAGNRRIKVRTSTTSHCPAEAEPAPSGCGCCTVSHHGRCKARQRACSIAAVAVRLQLRQEHRPGRRRCCMTSGSGHPRPRLHASPLPDTAMLDQKRHAHSDTVTSQIGPAHAAGPTPPLPCACSASRAGPSLASTVACQRQPELHSYVHTCKTLKHKTRSIRTLRFSYFQKYIV